MKLEILQEVHWLTLLHLSVAVAAIAFGTLQLVLEKGTWLHRKVGWVWILLMLVVSLSSFGIHEIRMLGPFSIIHLLPFLVFYTVWQGIQAIRAGDIRGHKKAMVALYVQALLITGAFTFWPGRLMHRLFFG